MRVRSHCFVRSVGAVTLHTPPRRARSSKHTQDMFIRYFDIRDVPFCFETTSIHVGWICKHGTDPSALPLALGLPSYSLRFFLSSIQKHLFDLSMDISDLSSPKNQHRVIRTLRQKYDTSELMRCPPPYPPF